MSRICRNQEAFANTMIRYYTGYAKFFDTSDDACDNVSWHLWNEFRHKVYLTKENRKRMNDLVDMMNDALRAAVERAGPQVHFIDYDKYVGMTKGRFCQPGDDESKGRSADREDAFFYEMKTYDKPMLGDEAEDWRDALQRHSKDDEDDSVKNNTLGVKYGAVVQQVIESHDQSLSTDQYNANDGMSISIDDYWIRKNKAKGRFAVNGLNATGISSSSSGDAKLPLTRSRASVEGLDVASNDTNHEIDAAQRLGSRDVISLVLPDITLRVFHPTQEGHVLIANLVLYTMSVVNVESMGESRQTDSGMLPQADWISTRYRLIPGRDGECNTRYSTWNWRQEVQGRLDRYLDRPRRHDICRRGIL